MQNNDTSLRVDERSISSYTFKIQNYSKYMRIFLPTKTFVIVQLHERRYIFVYFLFINLYELIILLQFSNLFIMIFKYKMVLYISNNVLI
jgi:hypothetical protein